MTDANHKVNPASKKNKARLTPEEAAARRKELVLLAAELTINLHRDALKELEHQ